MANRDKDIEKKSQAIQKYFDKIKITSVNDLVSGDIDNNDSIVTAFGSYKTSFDQYTTIDQARVQRYREYEQMCYVPELNAGLELYADDSSLYNEYDQVVETNADNQDVTETLEEL